MKRIAIYFLLFIVALLADSQSLVGVESGRRPNLIFILADDLGYGDLGCFGQQHIKTPHLDRLCAEGLKLTSHYSGSTVCAPSRYTLLTGRHIGRAATIGQGQQLAPNTQTIGTVLQAAGYRTACVGKWGLGNNSGLPNKQGFGHWFGFVSQTRAHWYFPDYVWRNSQKVMLPNNPKTHEIYVHDLFTEESLQFIRDNQGRRFFLYLPYTIPHAEVLVPEDSQAPYIGKLGDPERPPITEPYVMKGYNKPRYPRAARAGMISRMDRDIGRIRALLEELDLDEKTLVVFSSDNGPCRAGGQDIEFFQSRGGLRGTKRSLYEGGIRVPTIAWWPGTIKEGSVSDFPTVFYDWLPTFADLAGANLQGPTDGVSLASTLRGNTDQQRDHEYIFWDYGEKGVTSRMSALRKGRWKLIVNRERAPDQPELYDLSADLAEQNNLAEKHADVVDKLLPLMKQWWR
jgi:arylsulfatase A-like enzyme